MITTLTITALFLLIGSALCLLFKKMAPAAASQQIINANDCSPDRYRPMQRLLDTSDEQFLSSHPAFNKSMARKMRARRRAIFRGYLKCMRRDHGRICSSVRALMVESNIDKPELAKALGRSEMSFVCTMYTVECRLFLHALGLSTVDVSNLVASFENMRTQLRSVGVFQSAAA
jgi:hypothetical protein